jgi:hypothetical protein
MSSFEGYEKLPLPPPWRRNTTGAGYINELTHEFSEVHPFQRILGRRQDDLNKEREAEEKKQLVLKEEDEEEERDEETNNILTTTINEITANQSSLNRNYFEYRCTWSELGLFGDKKAFGLTIRFYDDQRAAVRFDGVDGTWHFSALEGLYGPVENIDLFVGARIKVFGRNLTIGACSGDAMRWNEKEAQKLLKQQEKLINKIEAVGVRPIVKRPTAKGSASFSRDGGVGGKNDLRRLTNELNRLGEQVANLGLVNIQHGKTNKK